MKTKLVGAQVYFYIFQLAIACDPRVQKMEGLIAQKTGSVAARPRRRQFHYLTVLAGLSFTDFLTFALAIAFFRMGHALPAFVLLRSTGQPSLSGATDVFYFLAAGFIVARYVFGDYSRRQLFWDEARITTKALMIAAAPDFLLVLVGGGQYDTAAFLESWIFMILALPLMRQLSRRIMGSFGMWWLPTALVGNGKSASVLYSALKNTIALGYDVRWLVSSDPENVTPPSFHLKSVAATDPDEVASILLEGGCFQAVLGLEDIDSQYASNLVQRLMEADISVAFVPPLHRLPITGVNMSYFFGRDVLLLQVSKGLLRIPQRLVKRAFDVVCSLAILIVLSPLFLCIAIAIKRFDGGPVTYWQMRTGRNGKQFRCFKFRTMVTNADEQLDRWREENPALYAEFMQTYKLRDDPRVTKPGRWLRRTSFDELPQLLNVLKGDMSMVGPRPIPIAQLREQYGSAARLYVRVRPGLTGLWQVSGRSDTTSEERVIYDEWYILNWSFWYDLVIVLQTVWIVMAGRGAY